jgi:hypothetical protein
MLLQGDILVNGARHPLIEQQPDVSFIENDYDLVRGRSHLQLITGPNMGGKSTYIRQLGKLSLVIPMILSFMSLDRNANGHGTNRLLRPLYGSKVCWVFWVFNVFVLTLPQTSCGGRSTGEGGCC